MIEAETTGSLTGRLERELYMLGLAVRTSLAELRDVTLPPERRRDAAERTENAMGALTSLLEALRDGIRGK